jgi:hypothetical protein
MKKVSMNKVKSEDEMRPEYRRDDLGQGSRGKYLAKQRRGTNLVLLDEKIAKAFPSSEAVNAALAGLLSLTEQTTRLAKRVKSPPKPRR